MKDAIHPFVLESLVEMSRHVDAPMSPNEFKRRVRDIIDGETEQQRSVRVHGMANRWPDDPEEGHRAYDHLVEEVLRSLGYGDGIDLVADMTRWYA